MKTFRLSLIIIFILYIGFCLFTFLNDSPGKLKYPTNCGKILKTYETQEVQKYKTTPVQYFLVRFEHKTEAVQVTPTTYLSYRVGDTVCFEDTMFYNREHILFFIFLSVSYGIGLIIIVVIAIIILAQLITIGLGGKWLWQYKYEI